MMGSFSITDLATETAYWAVVTVSGTPGRFRELLATRFKFADHIGI